MFREEGIMSRQFKEFKIEDVLDWQPQIEIDPLKLIDLSIVSNTKYPFYGQATKNNGIIGYFSLTERVLNNKNGKPTILIHSNNQNIVYLESPFYLKDGHGATSVLQSDFLNLKSALYIITAIRKAIETRFTYNSKATKIALKNTNIFLPIASDGSIDYSYMEERISKLEEECISELEEERKSALEAYLDVAGLNDFLLTAEEQNAIEMLNNSMVEFGEFKVGSKDGLFEIQKGKRLTKMDMRKGKTNYIGAISQNNGIRQKISAKPLHQGNCITVNYNGSVGEAFYQTEPFWASDDVNVLYLKGYKLNCNVAFYLITHIKKKGLLFSYQNKWNVERMEKTTISLPIKDKQPDYNFMETYIKATQKLVIKDIVDSKDDIISKSKFVVKNK